MNTSSESIPISEIFNFIPINGIPSLEHIAKETNLQRLYINLRLYLQGIELGTHNKQNFSLDFILNQATHENITDICKIIKCALQLQSNTDEYEKIIKNHSMRINLISLKIINTLLSCPVKTEFINKKNLLSNYLNYAYTEEEEHKYFVSSILPSFLSKNNKNLEVVWCKCISDKSLTLLSSISSSYLFSEAGIKILQQEQFWELLVHELVASEGFKYKSTMFLLKLSLNILRHYNVTINNKYINNTLLSEDNKSFDYFCILLDISIEKQIHLIQPSLCLLNKMFLPTMWLNIIYKKFLGHSNNTVAFYTLNYFMVNYNDTDLDFGPMFTALNKNDDSKLSKHILHRLQQFCKELSQEKYEKLLSESLGVNWNPVAFYNFYKHVLVDNKHLDCNITLEIIRNCKKLPHKYIRQGVMFIIFTKLKDQITRFEEVSIAKYINIILELMLDEAYYRYATKLINLSKLTVPDEFIQELLGFLSDPNTVNIKIKVDFLIEITERKNVPDLLVKGLYHDFKKRKYATIVLDRLSYLYLVKPSDLQDYLMERLDSDEEAHSIRHMDKPSYDLVSKSIGILTSNKLVSCNQQLLAFEVLFYMTKNNYTVVYNHWFNKILNESEVILPSLALNFVNLLIKIPTNFGRQHFVRLLNVYEEFFNSQRDDVLVRIYRNLDFIVENIDSRNLRFLEIACNKIFYLKARDDVENSIRYLVRSITLNYKTINKEVLEFLLKKLYDISQNDASGDFVIYYTTMYFKYLNFDIDLFPMYKFLIYPNFILHKNERAEYEICTDIYLDIHTPSPFFRAAEIRKWALEDVLFDENPTKIHKSVNYLLDHYRKTFNKRYFPDSTLHLHKLRTMQILIFMLPKIMPQSTLKSTLRVFLMESFAQESHQPSVRLLMQYLLVQLMKDEQSALEILLETIENSTKTHLSTIMGLLPVIYGLDLLKHNPEFSHKVIDSVLVWTMGPNFKLRYYAQKLIREVCHRHQHNFKFKKYDAIYKAVDAAIKSTTIKDDLYFDMMDYVYKERPWNDNKKLIYIVTVHIPEVCNVTPYEWEYFKIKQYWSKYSVENQNEQETTDLNSFEELSVTESNDNIQKKIVPWQDALNTDDKPQNRGKLIVVTSLIESAANLGGLSRTCEIFGGEMLVVDNIQSVEKKEFVNLSMTSEKWLKITEVKVQDLPVFLNRCREDNYKILGVEQTSSSTPLDCYKFEEKTVLLLGNESTGIPAPLIGLMDHCVEIPQFGMIRSLNVHVAGALVIWEYTKQQMITSQVKL